MIRPARHPAPGPLSGLKSRRGLAALTTCLWALLASPEPASLQGEGVLLVGLLVGLGVALSQATGWRVWRRRSSLDEREALVWARSHRIAFRALGLGVLVLMISSLVNEVLRATSHQLGGPPPLAFATGPRYLVALVLLLLLTPVVIQGWLEADGPGDHHRSGDSRVGALLAPLLAALAAVLLWGAAASLLPPRTVSARQFPSPDIVWGGARCATLDASRELGSGLGAGLNVAVDVCWNGHRAWLYDPGAGGVGPGPIRPHPSAMVCSLGLDATDFQNVSRESCTASAGSSGSLLVVARARASAGLGGWFARTLQARVEVGARGRVLDLG